MFFLLLGVLRVFCVRLACQCRVVDCMVDRVCMGRTIRPNSVDIEAEPWRGSIVPLDAGLEKRVPFALSVRGHDGRPSSDIPSSFPNLFLL